MKLIFLIATIVAFSSLLKTLLKDWGKLGYDFYYELVLLILSLFPTIVGLISFLSTNQNHLLVLKYNVWKTILQGFHEQREVYLRSTGNWWFCSQSTGESNKVSIKNYIVLSEDGEANLGNLFNDWCYCFSSSELGKIKALLIGQNLAFLDPPDKVCNFDYLTFQMHNDHVNFGKIYLNYINNNKSEVFFEFCCCKIPLEVFHELKPNILFFKKDYFYESFSIGDLEVHVNMNPNGFLYHLNIEKYGIKRIYKIDRKPLGIEHAIMFCKLLHYWQLNPLQGIFKTTNVVTRRGIRVFHSLTVQEIFHECMTGKKFFYGVPARSTYGFIEGDYGVGDKQLVGAVYEDCKISDFIINKEEEVDVKKEDEKMIDEVYFHEVLLPKMNLKYGHRLSDFIASYTKDWFGYWNTNVISQILKHTCRNYYYEKGLNWKTKKYFATISYIFECAGIPSLKFIDKNVNPCKNIMMMTEKIPKSEYVIKVKKLEYNVEGSETHKHILKIFKRHLRHVKGEMIHFNKKTTNILSKYVVEKSQTDIYSEHIKKSKNLREQRNTSPGKDYKEVTLEDHVGSYKKALLKKVDVKVIEEAYLKKLIRDGKPQLKKIKHTVEEIKANMTKEKKKISNNVSSNEWLYPRVSIKTLSGKYKDYSCIDEISLNNYYDKLSKFLEENDDDTEESVELDKEQKRFLLTRSVNQLVDKLSLKKKKLKNLNLSINNVNFRQNKYFISQSGMNNVKGHICGVDVKLICNLVERCFEPVHEASLKRIANVNKCPRIKEKKKKRKSRRDNALETKKRKSLSEDEPIEFDKKIKLVAAEDVFETGIQIFNSRKFLEIRAQEILQERIKRIADLEKRNLMKQESRRLAKEKDEKDKKERMLAWERRRVEEERRMLSKKEKKAQLNDNFARLYSELCKLCPDLIEDNITDRDLIISDGKAFILETSKLYFDFKEQDRMDLLHNYLLDYESDESYCIEIGSDDEGVF